MQTTTVIERMSRFLVPQLPFRGDRNVETIQRQRKMCWIICILCVLYWILGYSYLLKFFGKGSKHLFLGLMLVMSFSLASRAALVGLQYLHKLYTVYFELNLKVLAQRLSAEEKKPMRGVSFRGFLFYPDLEKLENLYRAWFLRTIKEVRMEKRKQMTLAQQAKLQQSHEELDRQIIEVADKLGKAYKMKRILRKNLSLSRKKSLLVDLIRFSVAGSVALKSSDREEIKLQKLVGILTDLLPFGF